MIIDAQADTLASLFMRRVMLDPTRECILVHNGDQYVGRTWQQMAADAIAIAASLKALGIQSGDRVIQWSENSYQWIACDLGIILAGAIHVPVHAPLTGAQAAYQIRHSGARLAILAGEEQANKLANVDDLPNDVDYLTHADGVFQVHGHATRSLSALSAKHTSTDLVWPDEASDRTPDTLATILYTSGTTGEPKGVMLFHGNLVANVAGLIEAFPETADDLRLCFLPLSHIFARTCDLYTWIACGSRFALARSRDTIIEDCQTVQPTVINGVPYFYERLQRKLVVAGHGETPGVLAHTLGGNIRACCSGGAALPDHVYDFFESQNVLLLQGYGLTESSPVISVSAPEKRKRGTVGQCLSNIDVRIADDCEILSRGPHIMQGYWQDPKATAAAIQDGWLHTGDLGELDDEGYLRITGRKKEIIVTATGKNIVPVFLESLLCQDELIAQAMVVGDDRNYLVALIVPDMEQLALELARRELTIDDPAVMDLYRQRMDARFADVSHQEQIGQFALLRREFTIEDGHLTPKSSLRREVIARDFAQQIERLYNNQAEPNGFVGPS